MCRRSSNGGAAVQGHQVYPVHGNGQGQTAAAMLNTAVPQGAADGAPPSLAYTAPHWALEPQATPAPWHLEVFNGTEKLDTIDLSTQARFVAGRSSGGQGMGQGMGMGQGTGLGAGLVDLELEHPSCSPHHAVVQHAYDGSLWLHDLNSAAGVRSNQQVLQPSFFHGLQPGTVLHFGQSPKAYVVRQGTANANAVAANDDDYYD